MVVFMFDNKGCSWFPSNRVNDNLFNRMIVVNASSFDEIKELAAQAVQESGKSKLKIAGHKDASYEAVFQVLALAQANAWDPVLSYEK